MLNFYDLETLKKSNKKYILSIGKRQPMHVEHAKSLRKILSLKDMKLIYVIGSSNLKGDPLFDPIVNPLNVEQQKEQFKTVFPNADPLFIAIEDVPDMKKWGDVMIAKLAEYNIKPEECVIYFIGKEEDKLKEDVSFDCVIPNEGTPDIPGMSFAHPGMTPRAGHSPRMAHRCNLKAGQWLIEALNFWGFAIWFDKELKVNLELSARNLRKLDLFESKNLKYFAAPEYLQELALKARKGNPELGDSPITLYDLSLQRLKGED